MNSFFISVITFLALLFPLVVVHELGHFFTAKLMKVKVLEFGFGFPPKLYSLWTGKTKVFIDENTNFQDEKTLLLSKNTIVEISFKRMSKDIYARKINYQKALKDSKKNQDQDKLLTGKIAHFENDHIILRDMQWSFNLLPLGGFVRLFGEQDNDDPESFSAKNPFSRLLILFSGAFINAIFPIILLFFLFLYPHDVVQSDLIVKTVMPNSPAEKSGLSSGDKIVSINGKVITSINDLHQELTSNLGEDTIWELKKGIPDPFAKLNEPQYQYKESSSVNLIPRWNPPSLKVVQSSSGPNEISISKARLYDPYVGTFDQFEVVETIIKDDQIKFESIKENYPQISIGDKLKIVNKVNISKNEISLEQARALNPLSGTHDTFTEGAVGIIVSITNDRLVQNEVNLLSSFKRSVDYLWQTLLISKNAFWGYFSGSTHPQFQGPLTVGPIGIGQITGTIATANVSISDKLITFVNLASILSLSLAIINILPIPALDGGRILFVFIEILRNGKKISPQKEGMVHAAGFVFLISLALFISFFDVARIFDGGSIFD